MENFAIMKKWTGRKTLTLKGIKGIYIKICILFIKVFKDLENFILFLVNQKLIKQKSIKLQ